MGMIKLKNVSKFYYSKGIIASGVTRINLDLDVGEFVVITGESGSGKSTLLNVISGLDTYEEGEMYIEGKETSHYTATDFEGYRQKYISSIFQSFNLVSSYTVYQNVALAMQIDGRPSAEIKAKVPAIIEKVGLSAYKNRKVSKLSGGQKQRVAIARALAKETKILVADEPTGNLDSASAAGIVDLLTGISKDKLVIVVTHNYDQFKDHATRVVKMHDGKIVEDTGVKKAADKPALQEVLAEEETAQEAVQRDPKEDRPERRKSVSYGTQVRLGLRNTFNLPAKFLLLLLVFLFVVSAVTSQYVSVKQAQDVVSETGWNSFFMHYDPSRIIVERQDRAAFTKADYEALENAPHVEKVIREDIMYDSTLWIEDAAISFSGYPLTLGSLEEELTYGRLPKKDNEVVIAGVDDGWTFGENPEAIVGNSYSVYLEDGTEISLKVVGLILRPMEDDEYSYEGDIFFTDKGIVEIRKGMYASRGTTTMHINGQDVQLMVGEGGLVINDKVPEGYILIPTSYDPMFKKGYAAGNDVKLNVKTLYYEESLPLTIMGTYGEKTFKKKTGLKNLSEHDGEIYINEMDYRRLYEKGSYQASVFVDDTRNMEGMVDMLERGGYRVLVLKDHIYNFMDEEVVNIITMPLAVIVCLAVFFIAYFVIRLILKSRGVYFATLRMLGMGRKPAKRIMRVELILVCLIAFAVFLLFIYLNYLGIIYREQLMNCLMYLTTRDYILLLLILLVMAVLIAGRFMRSIFKSSAMGAYREEA
ncbi:MAG: ATP-binding cassette domain-containing protein [Firmicutes bacterium]|nr:ATP-binding cassette domain-containing protein [Bacillota bacterium]MBQ3965048.1 ATP-binding cassette domain-containing protein [Bacillota bacterium]